MDSVLRTKSTVTLSPSENERISSLLPTISRKLVKKRTLTSTISTPFRILANEEINYYATEFRNNLITRSPNQPRRIKEQEKVVFLFNNF